MMKRKIITLTNETVDPINEMMFNVVYRSADKSLARTTKKKIERSSFFVRRGGHCCRGELVGRTIFRIYFEWLPKIRVWSP